MVTSLRELDVMACCDVGSCDRGNRESRNVNGERGCQVLKGTTRPADGFLCEVSFVGRGLSNLDRDSLRLTF